MRCERVRLQSGSGVCLRANRGVFTTYEAVVFDETLQELHNVGLAGHLPRAGVASGARWPADRVRRRPLVRGRRGLDPDNPVDLSTGDVIADLEVDFKTRQDDDDLAGGRLQLLGCHVRR